MLSSASYLVTTVGSKVLFIFDFQRETKFLKFRSISLFIYSADRLQGGGFARYLYRHWKNAANYLSWHMYK